MRMPFFSRPSAIETNIVKNAPGEIDAAGAVLAVAMRALLLEEKSMAGRDHCRVFEVRQFVGAGSLDRHTKDNHCARYGRDIPHCLLSEKRAAPVEPPQL